MKLFWIVLPFLLSQSEAIEVDVTTFQSYTFLSVTEIRCLNETTSVTVLIPTPIVLTNVTTMSDRWTVQDTELNGLFGREFEFRTDTPTTSFTMRMYPRVPHPLLQYYVVGVACGADPPQIDIGSEASSLWAWDRHCLLFAGIAFLFWSGLLVVMILCCSRYRGYVVIQNVNQHDHEARGPPNMQEDQSSRASKLLEEVTIVSSE
jgi:hypothetical protein